MTGHVEVKRSSERGKRRLKVRAAAIKKAEASATALCVI